jgi:glucosamine-6-phosphate deaminase
LWRRASDGQSTWQETMTMPSAERTLELAGARVSVYPDSATASRAAADQIAGCLRRAVEGHGRAVAGLATGGTPVAVYERLVEMHRGDEISFSRVTTYNLDEFYPISPLDPNSYRAYMHRHLFSKVDMPANRTHVLDGTVPPAFVDRHAAEYDRWIAADGGLDLQLLGIGRNGHIGFNEPSDLSVDEALVLPTRLADLHPVTIEDSARDFAGDPGRVPHRALTVGVAPILASRSILILAFGPSKAEAVARSLLGPITAEMPGSLLQTVSAKVHWMLDDAAARGLNRN